jgi:hypothetical protein
VQDLKCWLLEYDIAKKQTAGISELGS